MDHKNIKNWVRDYIACLIQKVVHNVFGIDNKKIVFSSYSGRSYSDNPKAISEKLFELNHTYKIIWLFRDPPKKKEIVPPYITCVKYPSLRALFDLATAKYWIDNTNKPAMTYKGKNQIYFQTWHGDRGFKKILYDALPENKTTSHIVEENMCDYGICGSKYGENQFISGFHFSGTLLKTGTPRNDVLLNHDPKYVRSIKQKLGIDDAVKCVLFAPTFRRKLNHDRSIHEVQHIGHIDVQGVLDALPEGPWKMLIRSHSIVSGISGIEFGDTILDVSNYEDMADMLLISDLLITDYSSCAGDFALLRRPIILYHHDRNDYLENEREFYFNIDNSPYWIAETQQELLGIIDDLPNRNVLQNCEDILSFYGTYESGNASLQVCHYLRVTK